MSLVANEKTAGSNPAWCTISVEGVGNPMDESASRYVTSCTGVEKVGAVRTLISPFVLFATLANLDSLKNFMGP